MKISGERNGVESSFSHMAPSIVLITITLNGHKLPLCNIYASIDQASQLQFMQEFNNYIIDKSELTSLTVGGDWNCSSYKKKKKKKR